MDYQILITTGIIILALAYVGRASWRTWKGSGQGCGPKCGGCSSRLTEQPQSPGRLGLPVIR